MLVQFEYTLLHWINVTQFSRLSESRERIGPSVVPGSGSGLSPTQARAFGPDPGPSPGLCAYLVL
jgi:hypothetical protein